MTNDELETELAAQISNERICTNSILALISIAEDRELPLLRGYSGTLDWLMQKYGYSKSAAWRRMESARILRSVPDAKEKLQSGVLNLTNLCKAQSSIRAQEKISRKKMTAETKAQLISAIENQTTDEAEVTLLELLPDTASTIHREHSKRIDADTERLALNFSNDDIENLRWIKDYLSHALPDATNGQIFARLMREFREKHSASKAKKTVLKAERRTCEYKDEKTGKVCGATVRVESDHEIPKAQGGSDAPGNRRCLCRRHNQFEARQKLGKPWANAWRRRPPTNHDASRDRSEVE